VSIHGAKIKSQAGYLGFSFCGIAQAEPLINHRCFNEDFIRKKLHQTLTYLETNLEKRFDPRLLLPEAKSIITLLLNYYPP
jgi:epoxyqueuosine reductase